MNTYLEIQKIDTRLEELRKDWVSYKHRPGMRKFVETLADLLKKKRATLALIGD